MGRTAKTPPLRDSSWGCAKCGASPLHMRPQDDGESHCLTCAWVDYYAPRSKQRKRAAGFEALTQSLRYVGPEPTLQGRAITVITRLYARDARSRTHYEPSCPFCGDAMQDVTPSHVTKPNGYSKNVYECGEGHRIALLTHETLPGGWL